MEILETYQEKVDEADEKLLGPVFDIFFKNKSGRNTLKLIEFLMDGETAEVTELFYTTLRMVDEAVDSDDSVKLKGARLNRINQLFLKTPVGDYQELKVNLGFPADKMYSVLNKSGVKDKGLENRLKRLKRKDKKFTEYLTKQRDMKLLVKAFKSRYGKHDGLLCEFFKGMYTDLYKEKRGEDFTEEELHDYFERIQTIPVIMGMKGLGVDLNNLPGGISKGEFYRAIDDANQGLEMLKNLRGKELIEDLIDQNRNYFSTEEMKKAGITREELSFLAASAVVVDKEYRYKLLEDATYKKLSRKLSRIAEDRVYRASAYFRRAVRVLEKMPWEGTLSSIRTLMLGYGLLAKSWAKKLHEHGYNPLDPLAEDDYLELKPKDEELLSLITRVKSINGSGASGIYRDLAEWEFLDEARVRGAMSSLGYRKLLGVGSC